MNVKLLIDAIIRQTMVLIAQLATTAGIRAPLAHLANQVFLELVEELEAQGVGRKVIADMFGLALRSYQLKVRRLSESSTENNRSLWEVVLSYVQENGLMTRAEILYRFRNDDEASLRGILHDLVESGLMFKTGRGHSTAYRAASPEELGRTTAVDPERAAVPVTWIGVYRNAPVTFAQLQEQIPIQDTILRGALDELVADGRISCDGEGEAAVYHCNTCIIPMGEPSGWEAAIFDHYQAMVTALCTKLRAGDTLPLPSDVIGGSTYSFDVWSGHPYEEQVMGLLRAIRGQISTLRTEVTEYNESRGRPTHGVHKVIFYGGQSVVIGHDPSKEHEKEVS